MPHEYGELSVGSCFGAGNEAAHRYVQRHVLCIDRVCDSQAHFLDPLRSVTA